MAGWLYEGRALRRYGGPAAGIDEVGRGPLAGPVVACAIILDRRRAPKGLDDSKKLTARAREALHDAIVDRALCIGLGEASVEEIDAINIRQATHVAMRRAVAALTMQAAHFLIDGNDAPSGLPALATTIVKGDSLCASIAAASIVAKVRRDRMMAGLAELYPHYGFADHAGYATARHLEALRTYGPCPAHRRSFAPVRTHFSTREPDLFTTF